VSVLIEEKREPFRAEVPSRYELVAELGTGGMASVHLARARGAGGFHKWVAIKRVHPHLAKEVEFVDMFLDEARIAAQLQHPNVAQVFELGQSGEQYFLAMEYLHGESLDRVNRRLFRGGAALPWEVAACIVARVARGLHHAHEARGPDGEPMHVVHRDVTPHNVFVTYDGHVKLTDFGVAKAAGRLTKTVTGTMKGKMAYASPEQLAGAPLDRRSDIFALGVVLWESCAGKRLFRGASDAETVQRILSGERPPLGKVRPEVPAALEAVTDRALQHEVRDRYATAAEMAVDLEALLRDVEPAVDDRRIAETMHAHFAEDRARKDALLREGSSSGTSWRRAKATETAPTASAKAEDSKMAPTASMEIAERDVTGSRLAATASMDVAARDATEPGASTVGGTASVGAGTVAASTLGGTVGAAREPGAVTGTSVARAPVDAAAAPRKRGLLWGAGLVLLVALGVTWASWPEAEESGVARVDAPPSGRVRVNTMPPGGRVFVDDEPRPGVSPLELELVPGDHVIRIERDGYARFSEEVTLAPGERLALRYVLSPEPPEAPVTAEAQPSTETERVAMDATESMDSRSVTERSTRRLASRMTRGRMRARETMEPAAPGALSLITSPWARVRVGGRVLGTTPLSRAEVASGSLRVELQAQGRGAYRSIRVSVPPGGHASRHLRLVDDAWVSR